MPTKRSKEVVFDQETGEILPFDPAAIMASRDLSADDIQEEITRRILEAEDVDAILGQGATVKAADILDVPLSVRGVNWNQSSIENVEGPGIFAVLQAKREDTGETVAVTCGGRSVLAQLYRLAQVGDGFQAGPVSLRIAKADRPTKAGYFPLWLRRTDPVADRKRNEPF